VVTNVPLSAAPGHVFQWSFDRVAAGSEYAAHTVQPVLHRYNDAKYVWDDTAARAWLAGFVRAHGAPPVIDLDAGSAIDLDAGSAIDLDAGSAIDLDAVGGSAAAPVVLDE
jgi:hypothetical protein